MSGELGKNLATVGKAAGVRVTQRGAQVRVAGEEAAVQLAVRVLEQLYGLAASGVAITGPDVEQAVRLLEAAPGSRLEDFHGDVVLVGARKRAIYPRTPTQKTYIHAFTDHDIVFGLGPAGTGKTYLAMAVAVAALLADKVKRIVLCRPAVEAGEKLGFLPGDLEEKVNPYLRPLHDALRDMVDEERGARLFQKGVIEVAPLAFMRGRTLSDSFIILDEAQNTTPEQMKMFLTRLGNGSRAAVTGDMSQVDLPRQQRSGLVEAVGVLADVPRIAMVHFTDRDVVRHPVVSDIVRAYDRGRAGEGRGQRS